MISSISNMNISIDYDSFVYTLLNGSKNCYVSLTIHLNTSHLFIHSWMIKKFYFKQFNLAQVNKVK